MRVHFDEKNIKWGVTAFLVILCSIIVFFAIYRFDEVHKILDLCISILAPFIYGFVMAYILCPVYNFTVRGMYSLLNRSKYRIPRALTISKAFGTIVAISVVFIVILGILWMIIPSFIESITKIIDMLPSRMVSFSQWCDEKLVNLPEAKAMVDSWIYNFTENATKFVTETVLPQYSSIATKISEGVIGVLIVVKNLFIAIIVCAYLLNSKDIFVAQIKKVIVALCSENTAKEVLWGAEFTNKTFGKFINGKIIDSFIIGIICFVCMSIFGWEYTLMISCIIGITNLIPFFGPFIGAIPSALLLLMVDYKQCIYFVIFILILQQFDGNILGPKILGDSTGLASVWVLFAVLVGGGLFGFIGMIVGIPVFAVIYTYISRAVNRKLRKRGYSTALSDYKIDSYKVKNKNDGKRR